MTFEHAKQYLARVLPWPQEGDEPAFVNLHWAFAANDGGKDRWDGRAFKSVKEAVEQVDYQLKRPGTKGIYVCMSTQRSAIDCTVGKGFKFHKAIRSQDNAVRLKCLYLDLDAKGEDKNSYATVEDAAVALTAFREAVGLPKPSMTVHSGGGLHVYWTMDRALTRHEWQPLADALVRATQVHGLKCDTGVTSDSARILRVPDTLNLKLDKPRPVRIIGTPTDFDYTVERLSEALAKFIVVDPLVALFPPKEPFIGEGLGAGLETLTTSQPIVLDELLPECKFLADTVAQGGKNNDNPLWNLTNLIATFCVGGKSDAHRMARAHQGYSQSETDEQYERKEREKEEKGLGWPACKTISANGAKQCATCPHFSAGKSPLNLAPKRAPQPVGLVAGAASTAGSASAAPVAPVVANDLPSGYTRRQDGIICRQETNADEGATILVPVCDYVMYDAWLQSDPKVLHFTSVTERKKKAPIELPLSIVGGPEMRKHLQEQGLMLPVGWRNLERISAFMSSWIKKLQETKDSVSSSPFGWSVKKGLVDGFVFGGHLWTPKGPLPAASPDTVIARHYAPTGDIAPWLAAAELVTSQSTPGLEAILAAAFGSPLVRFTGQPGVLMSCYSTASGVGKTTALKIAQAVWGDPIKAVQSLSDTANSVMGKMGEIRSLPLFWDELKTEEDTKKFVNITFQATQGKEKSRMTSRATQKEPGSWQTLLVSGSNDSLLDYVTTSTNTTTAGLYRIFEYKMERPADDAPGRIDTSEAALIVAKLHDNYGQVGLEYAKFLGENHERVANDVAAYSKALGQEVKTIGEERFWVALIACICVGAGYANELGFTKFNEPALKEFMLSVLAKMRGERQAQPIDLDKAINVSTVLAQFLKAMQTRHTLVTNRIHIARGRPTPGDIKIRGDIGRLEGVYVHIGYEDKLLRISSANLSEWLKEKGMSRHLFMLALNKEMGMKKVQGKIGGGTQFTSTTEYLLEIDLAGTPLANFIDEL